MLPDAELALLLYVRAIRAAEATLSLPAATSSSSPTSTSSSSVSTYASVSISSAAALQFADRDARSCIAACVSALVALWPRVQRSRIDAEIGAYCAVRSGAGDVLSRY